ncbi:hypothetical protein CRM22_001218 [Opisthorchis felineus]|uniref:C3H1-type domain-containing protein n=1 Tax=Opisthorchis felineus TaxID=147828 RepID=A0A4S2MBK7_OPIFE|nr:hypothetical protein CRM22_001218 [Opisthorchis felineus]TGZ73951.1 hypothetical protein CRM22_001218 [Opisthorchis felineus]
MRLPTQSLVLLVFSCLATSLLLSVSATDDKPAVDKAKLSRWLTAKPSIHNPPIPPMMGVTFENFVGDYGLEIPFQQFRKTYDCYHCTNCDLQRDGQQPVRTGCNECVLIRQPDQSSDRLCNQGETSTCKDQKSAYCCQGNLCNFSHPSHRNTDWRIVCVVTTGMLIISNSLW